MQRRGRGELLEGTANAQVGSPNLYLHSCQSRRAARASDCRWLRHGCQQITSCSKTALATQCRAPGGIRTPDPRIRSPIRGNSGTPATDPIGRLTRTSCYSLLLAVTRWLSLSRGPTAARGAPSDWSSRRNVGHLAGSGPAGLPGRHPEIEEGLEQVTPCSMSPTPCSNLVRSLPWDRGEDGPQARPQSSSAGSAGGLNLVEKVLTTIYQDFCEPGWKSAHCGDGGLACRIATLSL